MVMDDKQARAFAQKVIECADAVTTSLVALGTDFAGLAAAFVARGIQVVKSVALLTGHRQNADAMSVMRTVLEMDIDLAYIATADTDARVALFQDFECVSDDRFARGVESLHDRRVDRNAMRTLRERAKAAAARNPDEKARSWAGVGIDARARAIDGARREAAELRGEKVKATAAEWRSYELRYETAYRDACGATHSGPATLRYVFDGSDEAPTLKTTDAAPDPKPLLIAAGTLVALLDTAIDKTGLTKHVEHLKQLSALMDGESDTRSGDASSG